VPLTQTSFGTASSILLDSTLRVPRFRPPDTYFNSLDNAEEIRVSYVIEGIMRRRGLVGGWFHWYPFDVQDFDIPLRAHQPTVLSNVEIAVPRGFVGTGSIAPAEISFVEDGETLRAASGPEYERIPLPVGKELTVATHFRRSWFTILLLTLGMLLTSMVLGVVLGEVAKSPKHEAFGTLVGGLGILGIPALARSLVLTHPSGVAPLPYVVTASDLLFAVGWLIFARIAWSTMRKPLKAK
jgi:hypothetical protein